ncbi:MAG: RelA/SpoT family protein [Treponemataceae bacterium]
MTLDDFFTRYPQYEPDKEKIESAFFLAGYGSALNSNPEIIKDEQIKLRIASNIAKANFDSDILICAFLRNCPQKIEDEVIIEKFGEENLKFLRESERLASLKPQNKTLQQADSFRKMIFALVNSLQVILLELAFKLDKMQNLKDEDIEFQKALSQEVLEIWAPFANKLGISSLKSELEDLALKYLNNEVFLQIKGIVALKLQERQKYLEHAQDEIYKKAAKSGIDVTVTKRAKHFYSIYQKMKKRNKTAEELFDLLAIRIICQTTEDCYVMIGLVHSLWKPLAGRFKDYIAMPKSNGYQSLHTTVMCEGIPLEIQIRTKEMHGIAEHGVASHWLYKKGTNKDNVSIENLKLINRLREFQESNFNDEEFFNQIKEEILGDSIFVFTPKGDVKELPSGSTAIDFAYMIHSKIGQTICGAKANGSIIPLNKPLENTQIIEILTSPKAHPTQNQLQAVRTSRARSKINSWLQNNGYSEPVVNQTRQTNPASVPTGCQNSSNTECSFDGTLKIRVGDTSNYLLTLAQCCNPQYGDEILGYVSRGRGIIVHKKNCPNLENSPESKERSISLDWQ